MIDINIEAEKSLEKTGYNIVFHYPQKMSALPVVSFFTVSESGGMSADNTDLFRCGVVEVGIFSQVPSQHSQMAQQINKVMTDDGWSRINSMDVPEEKDGVFHRKIRYTKSFICIEQEE